MLGRNDTQVVPYRQTQILRKGEGHMLRVSEIHSAGRSRVEQTHNICHEPI